jgi:hypothetical protein
MHEDAVARGKPADSRAGMDDLTDRLVPEGQRRFAAHVPIHGLPGAQSAGADADDEIPCSRRRQGHALETDVTRAVKHDGAGQRGKNDG